MKDSRVKWASRSLIGDDATEGKDLMFPLGMAAIRAFNDDAEKWKAMYRILLHLQQMHNPQNKVVNFNADLWDGRHWDDLLLYLVANYQPLCDRLALLCDSGNLSLVASLLGTVPNIYTEAASDTGIAVGAGFVALVVGGVAVLSVDADGKVTMPGLLDPTGLALTPVGSNPGGALAASTLWVRTGNDLYFDAEQVAFISDLPSISGLLVAASNLSDVSNKATSLYNLLNGLGAPLSLPFSASTKLGVIEGSTAVYATIQTLLDAISGLGAATPGLSDVLAATNGSNVAKAVTPQKLLDLIHSTAAKTTLVDADELAMIDSAASNVAKRIAVSDLKTTLNLGATIAQGSGAAVAVNSTSVVQMASATNTVAAGDTFSFYLSGYVLNNSGANATYKVRVTIGATTFDLAFNAATAANASNVSYVRVFAEVAVISTSLIACTINVRTGVAAAVATIQNDVLAQDRSIVRTSTNNETGSKTVGIGLVSSTNTATQTFTRTRAEVVKGQTV
ncbi:MAG: hypothetical protein IPL86_17020 [Flavobacteriales bacterium]|nr:hypothetical protein [Flavobacteriales bacterium]